MNTERNSKEQFWVYLWKTVEETKAVWYLSAFFLLFATSSLPRQ